MSAPTVEACREAGKAAAKGFRALLAEVRCSPPLAVVVTRLRVEAIRFVGAVVTMLGGAPIAWRRLWIAEQLLRLESGSGVTWAGIYQGWTYVSIPAEEIEAMAQKWEAWVVEIGSDRGVGDGLPEVLPVVSVAEIQVHRCDAMYAHRERPLEGQCTSSATKRAPSEGRAVNGGPWIYGCDVHVRANPWTKWEALAETPAGRVVAALGRLAREQDAAATEPASWATLTPAALTSMRGVRKVALATSRWEAVRAMEALSKALRLGDGNLVAACEQLDELYRSTPIPSATLREWIAGWSAYDARGAALPVVSSLDVRSYYDTVTKRCPHGTRYPHECREGCEEDRGTQSSTEPEATPNLEGPPIFPLVLRRQNGTGGLQDAGAVPIDVEAARLEVVRLLRAAGGWDRTLGELRAAPLTRRKVLDAIESVSTLGAVKVDDAEAAADLAALGAIGRLLSALCENEARGIIGGEEREATPTTSADPIPTWESARDFADHEWGADKSAVVHACLTVTIERRDDQHAARLAALVRRRTDGCGNIDHIGLADDVLALVRRGGA